MISHLKNYQSHISKLQKMIIYVQNFINEIQASNILSDIKLNLTQDLNINYNSMHDVIQYAKTTHMPQKIVKFNKYKHKKSKWITHGVIKSIQTRDNMYRKYKMTDPNSTNYYTLKTNLKTYNTVLKKVYTNKIL